MSNKHTPLHSQQELQRILDYDPITGMWRFKYRPDRSFRWNARYAGKIAGTVGLKSLYRTIDIDGKHYRSARLAWMYHYGIDPGELEVDHIDWVHDNDAIANLRLATPSQQISHFPRTVYAGAPVKRPYRGVVITPAGRWAARMILNKKTIYLGTFDTPELARDCYNRAASEHFGEFAILNGVHNVRLFGVFGEIALPSK